MTKCYRLFSKVCLVYIAYLLVCSEVCLLPTQCPNVQWSHRRFLPLELLAQHPLLPKYNLPVTMYQPNTTLHPQLKSPLYQPTTSLTSNIVQDLTMLPVEDLHFASFSMLTSTNTKHHQKSFICHFRTSTYIDKFNKDHVLPTTSRECIFKAQHPLTIH